MLLDSSKFGSSRSASHHSAFMGSCLTSSHPCFPYLPSGIVSPCVPDAIEARDNAWCASTVEVRNDGWWVSSAENS